MVLSLPFILAIVGASVGLLVGILIFGEVSEAIECPAGEIIGGGGITIGTFASNVGSLGSSADGEYYEANIQVQFNNVTDGAINQAIRQEGTASLDDQGEVRFGTASQWGFLHRGNIGNNITSINFWLRGDVDGSPEYPLLQTTDPNDATNGVYLYTQGSFAHFHVYEAGTSPTSNSLPSGRPPDDSQWHMITLVMNKGNATTTNWLVYCLDTICQNGILNGAGFSGLGINSNSPLVFGNEDGESAVTENSFDLDDITVWQGYQLTPANISTLWNGGSGTSSGASGASIGLANQILHITFDADTFDVTPTTEGQIGSEQCEQAKDTAWTVIGIMPVALFFGLFALFSSVMPTRV